VPPAGNDETASSVGSAGEAETARAAGLAVMYGRHPSNPKLLAGVLTAIALGVCAYVLWTNRAAATSAGQPPHSLAVLPFKSLASDARDQTLELGMADTLIAKLAAVRAVTPAAQRRAPLRGLGAGRDGRGPGAGRRKRARGPHLHRADETGTNGEHVGRFAYTR
jgi:hypothetical protein